MYIFMLVFIYIYVRVSVYICVKNMPKHIIYIKT